MSNTISLFGAYQSDGKVLIENPSTFYRDVSVSKIVYVRLIQKFNYKGQIVPAFMIVYQNPKGLTYETFYLPTNGYLLSLENFLAGLVALNTWKNTFTLYTGLVKTSNQPSGYFFNQPAANLKVLINDDFGAPLYLASRNQTKVSVDIFNAESRLDFYFTGDQNYSGMYKYFTAYGNQVTT